MNLDFNTCDSICARAHDKGISRGRQIERETQIANARYWGECPVRIGREYVPEQRAYMLV